MRRLVLMARSAPDTPLGDITSIGDLVKATISEQQFIIEQLEHYISGQRD